jgi:hypothetical protein
MHGRRDIRKELTTDEKWRPIDVALNNIKRREKEDKDFNKNDYEEYIVHNFSK